MSGHGKFVDRSPEGRVQIAGVEKLGTVPQSHRDGRVTRSAPARRRRWTAGLEAVLLLVIVLYSAGVAQADESPTPEPSPSDSVSTDPSPTGSASTPPSDSPQPSKPPSHGGGSTSAPGVPVQDPGPAIDHPLPGFVPSPGSSSTHSNHEPPKTPSTSGSATGGNFRIDILHDSLQSATSKARAATAAAEEAARVARRAKREERHTETALRVALKSQAHASVAVDRAVRLINASPVGNVIATDPTAAALIAAADSPDSYLQQGARLTGLAESISSDLSEAEGDLATLESAQVDALARQQESSEALSQARASQRLAERAQRQAKKVFLRVVGEGKAGTEEAWWISQFASSELGQMLAGLEGGPHVSLVMARPNDGAITSPFGMRMHPILHTYKLHSGTDFAGGDSSIHAAAAGTVVRATYDVAYGNYVVIWHGQTAGESVATLYAHCSSLRVSEGDRVHVGQWIGNIGATGYTTGPHLHFEVRIDGRPIDPESVLR
ncbi:MAG: peptidoglycan DD-metalloendopeptidase family protein [Actinomycetes bacterium]